MVLIMVLIVAASLGVWIHFARKAIDANVAAAEAKAIEEANKRYPVKGRRTKERVAPMPPPAIGPTGAETVERPRIRIRKAEE